jgi:predicted nucleotidyltransferase
MPEAKFAYLHGSYATGLANENSDIDIAIVMKEHCVPVNSIMTEITYPSNLKMFQTATKKSKSASLMLF